MSETPEQSDYNERLRERGSEVIEGIDPEKAKAAWDRLQMSSRTSDIVIEGSLYMYVCEQNELFHIKDTHYDICVFTKDSFSLTVPNEGVVNDFYLVRKEDGTLIVVQEQLPSLLPLTSITANEFLNDIVGNVPEPEDSSGESDAGSTVKEIREEIEKEAS
jgi:hypothetical protein